MKKYRNDIILIVSILIISLIVLLVINLNKKNDNLKAIIYYKDEIVLTIDLSTLGENEKEYIINGDLGIIKLGAKYNSIRVIESTCLNHTCEHQNYISNTASVIVCLPNLIYIKLVSNNIDLDVVI